MESFGAYLKSLREEKGKTLEDISQNTKIALANLEFLEKDRYDLLPPRVFVKGFIRSYAQELGLNPEGVSTRFEEFIKDGEMPDYLGEEHPLFQQPPRSHSFITSRWFTVALTVAGLVSIGIIILTGVTRLFFPDQQGTAPQPTVRTAQPAGHDSSAARIRSDEHMEPADFPERQPVQTGKKVLEIKAIAKTWIRIEPDTGPAEELMMSPGDIQVFTAKEGFRLLTGNAGGIRLRFNGRELPVLGKANQTLSLTLPLP